VSGGGIKSQAELLQLEKHLISEGATSVSRNGKSVVRLKDGKTIVSLHMSISDKNGWRPLRSQIKRAGHTWPGDRHQETKGQVKQKRTNKELRQLIVDAIATLGDEDVRPGKVAELVDISGGGMSTVYAHLEALGYTPNPEMKPKARGRTWRKHWPAEDEEYPEIAKARQLLEKQPLPPVRTEYPSTTEPVTYPKVSSTLMQHNATALQHEMLESQETEHPEVQHLDFIDERDSWTIDLPQVQHLTIDQLRMAYHAAGLLFELRVWHTKGEA
jgi:hypothetical protein